MRNRVAILVVGIVLFLAGISEGLGAAVDTGARPSSTRSITDRSFAWPSSAEWRRVLLMRDYNTRVVILGTCALGCAAGLVGSFTLLRKRALMGDALSHATLPGIGLAFIVATQLGGNGKALPVLLLGATISGMIGVGTILAIRHSTRIKEDSALAIVLSVFFGLGVSLLGLIQQMDQGHAAGLEAFIYGKTASMTANDARLIGWAALFCTIACVLMFKELKLLCFDEAFAGSRGFPVLRLDLALMGLVVIVSIVGLQAVGLILIIALLVIPAAAARFWTERMWLMALISALLGAVGGMLGAGTSALFSRLPSGAMIVLVCTGLFFLSLVFGSKRGVLIRLIRRQRVNRSVDKQHLLRAIYETLESAGRLGQQSSAASHQLSFAQLLDQRSWSAQRLHHALRRAGREGLVEMSGEQLRLTESGKSESIRLTREHRLWELYLITHADVAPSVVDRAADAIEHVLDPALVDELERLLAESAGQVPPSPHALAAPSVGVATSRRGVH